MKDVRRVGTQARRGTVSGIVRRAWWFVARPLPRSVRLLLAALLLNLPLMVIGVIALGALNDDIDFDRRELQGIDRILPAVDLTQFVQRYRGAAQLWSAGNAAAAARADQLQKEVGRQIDRLDAAMAGAADRDASVTSALGTLNEAWTVAIQHPPGTADGGFERISRVIAALASWKQTIAEESGLVLDPDAQSYHLGQALVFQLPALIENAAQARGLGAEALQRRVVTPEARQHLLEVGQRVGQRQDAALHELDQIGEGHAQERAALQRSMLKAGEAVRQLLADLQRNVLDPATPSGDADAFYAEGSEAVDGLYVFVRNAYGHLEAIIRGRLQRLLLLRTLVAVAALAGIGLTLCLLMALERRRPDAEPLARPGN